VSRPKVSHVDAIFQCISLELTLKRFPIQPRNQRFHFRHRPRHVAENLRRNIFSLGIIRQLLVQRCTQCGDLHREKL
jgi:hypothetical protein